MSTELATHGRAVSGVQDTLQALTERRVQTLLLSADFGAGGGRCPSCGLLVGPGQRRCPADGSELEPLPDLREAAVEAALLQDAEVIVASEPSPELARGHLRLMRAGGEPGPSDPDQDPASVMFKVGYGLVHESLPFAASVLSAVQRAAHIRPA